MYQKQVCMRDLKNCLKSSVYELYANRELERFCRGYLESPAVEKRILLVDDAGR
jgi:hypothetical protein